MSGRPARRPHGVSPTRTFNGPSAARRMAIARTYAPERTPTGSPRYVNGGEGAACVRCALRNAGSAASVTALPACDDEALPTLTWGRGARRGDRSRPGRQLLAQLGGIRSTALRHCEHPADEVGVSSWSAAGGRTAGWSGRDEALAFPAYGREVSTDLSTSFPRMKQNRYTFLCAASTGWLR